jgi:hypothetical protein
MKSCTALARTSPKTAAESTPRQDLKEAYSTIEEAKADITGLYALRYMMDKGQLQGTLGQGAAAERKLYTTFLASAFRTLHFGLTDSHARGMAIQMNYLLDKGGFVSHGDGTFSVDFKQDQAGRDGPGPRVPDHRSDRRLRACPGHDQQIVVIRPDVQKALDKMKDGAKRYPAGIQDGSSPGEISASASVTALAIHTFST